MADAPHPPKLRTNTIAHSHANVNPSLASPVQDAIPEVDPNSTASLLADRLAAWKAVVTQLEDYMSAMEKIHRAQSKEYERVLKALAHPLRNGDQFDQSLGGIAGLLENMRANTQGLVASNAETEKSIHGTVLPVLDRLLKEIKHKEKELELGAARAAKDVEKARNATQKQIELLGQHTAAFESAGARLGPLDDPYVVARTARHRLHRQVLEENNHHNDLVAVQTNVKVFEAHIVAVLQQSLQAFNQLVVGQTDRVRAYHDDTLRLAQRVPADFEWLAFARRSGNRLVDPKQPPRDASALAFPNMDHPATRPLIEGSLERKSRNRLTAWRYATAYYVVTPSRYLHEFKDSPNEDANPRAHDAKPELSLYLPDAVIGAPVEARFQIKGRDRSSTLGGKLARSAVLRFRAHTPADAERWFDVIRTVAGATGPAEPMLPVDGDDDYDDDDDLPHDTKQPFDDPSADPAAVATVPPSAGAAAAQPAVSTAAIRTKEEL